MRDDDYQVYTTVLRHIRDQAGCDTLSTSRFVIVDSTVTDQRLIDLSRTEVETWCRVYKSPQGLRDAARDFQAAARRDLPLERRFLFSGEYVLIRWAELDSLLRFSDRGWAAFYSRYSQASHGFFRVSRVGYSRDRRHALLWVMHNYGTLGMDAGFFIVSKHGDEWRVDYMPFPRVVA